MFLLPYVLHSILLLTSFQTNNITSNLSYYIEDNQPYCLYANKEHHVVRDNTYIVYCYYYLPNKENELETIVLHTSYKENEWNCKILYQEDTTQQRHIFKECPDELRKFKWL